MKYIKSKGGYFYKIYSNGKKKRISKEEFMKHNKKSKKKSLKKYKMKGGQISETLRENILKAIEEVLNSHYNIPNRTRISLEDFETNDIRIDDPYEYLKDVINKVLDYLRRKYHNNNNVQGILLSLTNEEVLEQVLEKIPTKTATALKPLGVHNSFNGREKYLLSEESGKKKYLSIKKGQKFNYKLWGTNKLGIPRIRIHNANYDIENPPNNQYVSVVSKNKNNKNNKLINVIKLDDSHPTLEQDLGKKQARIERDQTATLNRLKARMTRNQLARNESLAQDVSNRSGNRTMTEDAYQARLVAAMAESEELAKAQRVRNTTSNRSGNRTMARNAQMAENAKNAAYAQMAEIAEMAAHVQSSRMTNNTYNNAAYEAQTAEAMARSEQLHKAQTRNAMSIVLNTEAPMSTVMPNAVINQIPDVVCLIPSSVSSQYVDNRNNSIKEKYGTTVLSNQSGKSNCTHNCYKAYELLRIRKCEDAIIADVISSNATKNFSYAYEQLWINILLQGKDLYRITGFTQLDIRELDKRLMTSEERGTILDESTEILGSYGLSIDDFIERMQIKKFAILNIGGQTILIYKLKIQLGYLYFNPHNQKGFYLVRNDDAFRLFLEKKQYFDEILVPNLVDFSSETINAM